MVLSELLAPAGSYDVLVIAVNAGADAVYIAGQQYGARAFAKNFTLDEIEKAVEYAHLNGVKVHVTVNTLVNNFEIADVLKYLFNLYKIGVDAVIVQDFGICWLLKTLIPDLEVHGSTQMALSNYSSIKWAAKNNIKRVVLPREIDVEKIAEEQAFDGFYGLATSLDIDDLPGVLKVAAGRWEIEECFRFMKNEMKARPAFMSREDRLRAHFLICFIALLVYRILEKKLDNKFSCLQIIDTLKEMCMEQVRGEGWRPLYTRTEITDALHDAFGFRTDYEIVPQASMKKIIRKTKGR